MAKKYGVCKLCLRSYVRPFGVHISFPFMETKIDWEGCADCAHAIRRQLVDFMLRVTQPPARITKKIKKLHIEESKQFDYAFKRILEP